MNTLASFARWADWLSSKVDMWRSILLSDGVDFVVDLKGTLDGRQLNEFLRQSSSVKRAARSQTPMLLQKRRTQLELAGSCKIPTFAYCAARDLKFPTIAKKIKEWIAENDIELLDHPDVIAIHDEGLLVDTCNPVGPGRNLLGKSAANGLYHLEMGDLTLAQTTGRLSSNRAAFLRKRLSDKAVSG